MSERDTSAVETADSSSSMVALRTIVMIAFLVAIPLMAVFGTGLPDSLRTAMHGGAAQSHSADSDDRRNELAPGATTLAESPGVNDRPLESADHALAAPSSGGPTEHARAGNDMPPAPLQAAASEANFDRAPRASITDVRTSTDAPRARITKVRAVDGTEAMEAPAPAPTAPLWAPGPRTAISPRSRNTTAHNAAADRRYRATPPTSVKRSVPDASWQATAYSPPAAPAVKSTSGDEQDAPANDPFARGEQRLRQYGATHYRLESWGDEGDLFRCSANVSLPNVRYGARHFEATAASPSQAIDRLLEQVEAWRTAQR